MAENKFIPQEHVFYREDAKNPGKKKMGMTAINRTVWFRSSYPDGKITKTILSQEKNNQGYPIVLIEARVYAHASDPVDAYLASGLSMKAYDPTNEVGCHYMECAETAAKARALRDAGFCLPDEDALEEAETSTGSLVAAGGEETPTVNYSEAPLTRSGQTKFWPEATELPENQLTVPKEVTPVKPVEQPTVVPQVTAPRKRGGAPVINPAPASATPVAEPETPPKPAVPVEETKVEKPHRAKKSSVQSAEPTVAPTPTPAKFVELPVMDIDTAKNTVIKSISSNPGFVGKTYDEIIHQMDNESLKKFLDWASKLNPIAFSNPDSWAEIAAARFLLNMMV